MPLPRYRMSPRTAGAPVPGAGAMACTAEPDKAMPGTAITSARAAYPPPVSIPLRCHPDVRGGTARNMERGLRAGRMSATDPSAALLEVT